MREGLGFRKTTEVVAAFVKKYGSETPRRAVLCTYDFHPERFETVLLPELNRRGRWFRTLVLADAGALQSTGTLAHRGAAPTYELAPVRLPGSNVFHPKLFVLQARQRVLVGVGSANLTPGGLGANLELMLFADNTTAEGRKLAASAISFLSALHRAPRLTMTDAARRFLARVIAFNREQAGGPLLHNLERPLLEQIGAGRPPGVTRAAVLSPWHSSGAAPNGAEPAILQAVGTALGAVPTVYTEGLNGKAPDLGKKITTRILGQREFDVDETDEDAPEVAPPRHADRLHAKAYLATGKRGTVLWFGSANCTTPALRESVQGGGNVELLLQVALDAPALAALQHDLEERFVSPAGVVARVPSGRVPSARGIVLAGEASAWGTGQRLTLELATPSKTTRAVLVGTSPSRDKVIELVANRNARTLVVAPAAVRRLVHKDDAIPSVLWEYVGRRSVPFPVSVPCAPDAGDAVTRLEDVLDELAGRPPAALNTRKRRVRTKTDGTESPEDERELELLTKTQHQGLFDRVAVRVELLRRRLSALRRESPAASKHYESVLERLPLAPGMRSILLAHLTNGRDR